MSEAGSIQSSLESIPGVLTKSEYDKVIFHNVADSYYTDADVECCYTLTSTIIPTQGDRVALFKIGWEAPHQYIKYEWATVPEEEDKNGDLSVLFRAQDLPMDDGEFYQFCYISAEGFVRGASVPFRFRSPLTDDLIEIEDSDNDLLIIRSRTAVIEEKLREVVIKNNELLKSKSALEKEVQDRKQQCVEREEKLKLYEEKIDQLKQELEAEVKKREAATVQLLDKIEEAQLEKNHQVKEIKSHLVQNDAYIHELQDTIKVLYQQKDDLAKKLANEIQDKEAVQKNLSATEARLKSMTQKGDQLAKELLVQQEAARRLQQQIRNLEKNYREEQKKASEMKEKAAAMEDERQRVVNQLLDTEHMLAAMEKSKHLATEELMAHAEFKEKVTKDLESTRSELHNLKVQHKTLEADHEHQGMKHEKMQAEYKLVQLKAQENYNTLEKNYNDLLAKQKKWQTEEVALKLSLADLASRLKTGAAEFQSKYIECLKLDRKFNKLKKKYKERIQVEGKLEKDKEESPVNEESVEEEKDGEITVIERYETQLAEKEQLINHLRQELSQLKVSTPVSMSLLQQNNPALSTGTTAGYANPPYYPYPCAAYGFPVPTTNPFLYESDIHLDRQLQSSSQDTSSKSSQESSTSLPPPIQPEITPQAKLAAIAALTRVQRHDSGCGGDTQIHSFHLDEEVVTDSYVPSSQMIPRGNSIRSPREDVTDLLDPPCPICGIAFGPGNWQVLQDHMDTHFGQECPVCSQHFMPEDQSQLQTHVQSHFSEEW